MLLRKILLWLALPATALLAVWSIVGAFLGAEQASKLFNSTPMVCIWCGLAVLLAVGVVHSAWRLRRPVLAVMHLGALLIIIGSMINSCRGHELARYFGIDKPVRGYMVLFRGHQSNSLLDSPDGKPAATLPFGLKLEDCRVECYPPADPTWLLVAEMPADRPAGEPQRTLLQWRSDKPTGIPGTSASVRVLRYVPCARAIYSEGTRRVLVIRCRGQKLIVPAEPGRQVMLENPRRSLRISGLYTRPSPRWNESGLDVVEDPSARRSPAVKVEIEEADGDKDKTVRLVFQDLPMHGQADGLAMRYVETWPIDAVADAASDTPAMLLEVSFADRSERVWLAPETPNMPDGLEISSLLAQAEKKDRLPEVTLYLVRPTSQIKRYQARLAVLESGRNVAEKLIEVNRPLHYGGFHVYWHYCDPVDPRYVMLSVRSDSGLTVVYAGFALLCGGIFAWGWAKPAWKSLSRRSDNGD